MDTNTVRVELLPIFEDNYVFVIVDSAAKEALVIDPGESSATIKYLSENNLKLRGILLTHHHNDHIGGAQNLKKEFATTIYAPLKNKSQIPFADIYLKDGDAVDFDNLHFDVMALPGHTIGHVAFYNPAKRWLFSGDVLFGLGCGRLFEGTPEQGYESLQKIKTLPPQTLVYCAHEYTETNLQFCKMLGMYDDSPILGGDEDLELYENELSSKRELNIPSVPLKLFIELKCNPFLLAKNVTQFAYLRDLRNRN
jgi:hydroxyacylglutathione hydrolase